MPPAPRPLTVAQRLIAEHLVDGDLTPGAPIAIRIDQTLTQDATGTLVMLELEAMGLDRVRTEASVQYVDHNVLQTDFKNQDDHLFLRSACQRFGLWYSRAGNGVSHPVHMERFGAPGKTLIGSDSHTPAAGSMGMLALGSGGLDVAFAMAGEPLRLRMPQVLGVRLVGEPRPWVSAKDVVLEMLRRYDVDGCRGFIIEYHGPGLAALSAMDRHVIANMGTEMGATTTVFPSDDAVRAFLRQQGREDAWRPLVADAGARYDREDEIDLATIEPLIALPSSPGNVVTVRSVAGREIHQAMVGSSANPGLRDFWIAGMMLRGRTVSDHVSFDVNPTSRQIIENLAPTEAFAALIHGGARFHQAGCNGCIGMGQAPGTGRVSLRTVPRNFPGRSGTRGDQVFLCSPETATASAITGRITDPRDFAEWEKVAWPAWREPERVVVNVDMLPPPPAPLDPRPELERGPNIHALPTLPPLADAWEVPVAMKVGDDISTDEILRAGAEVLSLRSNIPRISRYVFTAIDEAFPERADRAKADHGGHVVVAGGNYAQGSSREHAALAPRYLGQVAVIAKSYARIGWQNLVNFGVVPLEFSEAADYELIAQGDLIRLDGLRDALARDESVWATHVPSGKRLRFTHRLTNREVRIVLDGGVLNHIRDRIVNQVKDTSGQPEGVEQTV